MATRKPKGTAVVEAAARTKRPIAAVDRTGAVVPIAMAHTYHQNSRERFRKFLFTEEEVKQAQERHDAYLAKERAAKFEAQRAIEVDMFTSDGFDDPEEQLPYEERNSLNRAQLQDDLGMDLGML